MTASSSKNVCRSLGLTQRRHLPDPLKFCPLGPTGPTVSCISDHQSCSSSLPGYIWSPMKGVWNSSHSKFCRSTSCYLIKHNLVMAPKASLTYLPTTQAWRQSLTLAVVRWPTASENLFGPVTFAQIFQ